MWWFNYKQISSLISSTLFCKKTGMIQLRSNSRMYIFYELNFIDTVEAVHIMQDNLDMQTSSSLYMKDPYTYNVKCSNFCHEIFLPHGVVGRTIDFGSRGRWLKTNE